MMPAGPNATKHFLSAHTGVAVLWLAGVVLRDRWPITAVLYYIPVALVIAGGLLALWLARGHAGSRRWLLCAAFTLAAGVKMLAVDVSWNTAFREPRFTRAVHWNVAHGHFGPEALARTLAEDGADIYLLSEFPDDPRFQALPEAVLPGAFVRHQNGMLLISRFPFVEVPPPELIHARAWAVRLQADRGVELDLLAVDFTSDPRLSRRYRLQTMTDWIAAREKDRPLLILGDFNTPRDSIHFEPLRRHVLHAYELRGNMQWPCTWPIFFPVYSIDHAWVRHTRVYAYDLRWSRLSDHARQVMEIRPIRRQ